MALDRSVSRVSVAILAAGSALRMGREKVLLELGGQPLVRRAASEALALGPRETLVVANSRNEAAVAAALDEIPVRVLVNPHAARGIGTSIALAASATVDDSQAMLVLQADQPFVDCDMLRRIADVWLIDAPAYVAAAYGGIVTTPVLFARALFAELRGLDADNGAKAILERHASNGLEVDFDAWRGLDVDTPEDYRRAVDSWERLRGS
jgi:molybdenum cofactor cytidylyltransferase